ncbi:MAG: hypothetical protein HY553_18795 [Elusimicrobia bacterium]|nr:hypothetical protein [Elusimicrobiota bacterium]
MTRHWLARACGWLASVAAAAGTAWAQGPVPSADDRLLQEIDRAARSRTDTSKLSCRTDSASPFPELEKAKAALRAAYPQLPWSEVNAVADEVAKHDMAIELGTNCQDYVFGTYLKALEAAAFAGHRCQGTTQIDLAQCLQELTCRTGGRNSRFCGAKFSWER